MPTTDDYDKAEEQRNKEQAELRELSSSRCFLVACVWIFFIVILILYFIGRLG